MTVDADVIAEIDKAFGGCAKPDHFGNYLHCEECAEHDQLLRDRTRETLTIEEVGNAGWDPLCFSSAAGIAYYFPKLARLAISPLTYEQGWYGDQLLFHLTHGGTDNRFLQFCNSRQRRAVGHLLAHFEENPAGQEERLSSDDGLVQARALWCAP